MRRLIAASLFALVLTAIGVVAVAQNSAPVGYSDTPVIPGQKWKVHDIERAHPPMVTPGATPGAPPSDAIVLFDGKDLSQWKEGGTRRNRAGRDVPIWKVENGYMEIAPGAGSIYTKESFGDVQLHIEWAAPAKVEHASQDRGNSGVLFMQRYEIQVLDSWDNITYADGQAGSLYGQWPPLVNASRRPGEWQTYDIVFEAPVFDGDKVVKPAFATVFHNGVLLHHRKEILGTMVHRRVGTYTPHPAQEPLSLQQHNTPVRFRNIWIRRLKNYDEK